MRPLGSRAPVLQDPGAGLQSSRAPELQSSKFHTPGCRLLGPGLRPHAPLCEGFRAPGSRAQSSSAQARRLQTPGLHAPRLQALVSMAPGSRFQGSKLQGSGAPGLLCPRAPRSGLQAPSSGLRAPQGKFGGNATKFNQNKIASKIASEIAPLNLQKTLKNVSSNTYWAEAISEAIYF